ncbi:MAG: MOSC domain-containing protein [Acidimicrobiales bacterium]|nr:MOSC domain-containing protein [Acidimicrobiales bacterium]
MDDLTISQLWRYPVKSMAGQALPAVDVDGLGVVGDRGWACRDEVRGGIRGAKKLPGLMAFAARYLDEPASGGATPHVEVTLPDGTTVSSDDPQVHARVGAAIDHPVTLLPLAPADDLDHYRRGAPDSDDLLTELQQVFGRDADEPLPDLSLFPPEIIEFESPPGTHYDAYPLLVLTEASLAHLASLAPDSRIDVRRFRPNVVLAGGSEGFVEQGWVGRTLHVGDVELDVVGPCPRCVMITHGFADLPQDRRLMRTVVREADQNLGVYATVRAGGRLRVGQPVEVS